MHHESEHVFLCDGGGMDKSSVIETKSHSAVVLRPISRTQSVSLLLNLLFPLLLPFPTAPQPLQVQLVRALNRTTFSYSVIRSLLKMT